MFLTWADVVSSQAASTFQSLANTWEIPVDLSHLCQGRCLKCVMKRHSLAKDLSPKGYCICFARFVLKLTFFRFSTVDGFKVIGFVFSYL